MNRGQQRRRRRWAFTSVITIAMLLLGGSVAWAIWPHGNTAGPGERLRVVTTTNFLTDTVRRIAGPHARVSGLMGPGVDPHLYKPTASDVSRLRDADVVIAVGLYLEGSMQHVLDDVAETTPVIEAGESIPPDRLLTPAPDANPAEEHDPHVWFDVRLWSVVAGAVRDGLAEQDPAHAADYRERTGAYHAELDRLDGELRRRVAEIPPSRRVLVTSHDAFRYFGRAYGFDVLGIQGISTGDEATTGDISRVAGLVARRDIPAVFVESSVPKQTLQAVLAASRARGHQLRIGGELFSDSAGAAGTPESGYVGMLRANVDRLVERLS